MSETGHSLVHPGSVKRVLLVEDNPADARLVRALLDESLTTVFEVTVASRLGEAIAVLHDSRFELILLDLSLPDARGLDTVTNLREAAHNQPIVVMTGLDDEQLAVRALQAGAQDYIVKGQIDGRGLGRTILYAIERNSLLLELERATLRQRFLATHDSLTGLPNRSAFNERLTQAVAYAERYGQKIGVLFLDLDNFKAINDSLGHSVGDKLLRLVATRLTSSIRNSDTAARLAGDEFTILLQNLKLSADAGLVAENVVRDLAQPVDIDGWKLSISASVGIAVYPDDGCAPEQLINSADTAMYAAKERGHGTYEFCTPDLNDQVRERRQLERRLMLALENNEFVIHYQPLIDTRDGSVVCAEALLRWDHPELGLMQPDSFIPVAEETGLIEPIGDWVLRAACGQQRDWHAAGHPNVRVSVNISTRQLREQALASKVKSALRRSGVPPGMLQLEISESAIVHDRQRCMRALSQVRDLGVRIAIDDYGTGNSSVGYLEGFPADVLKIDRTFVSRLTPKSSRAAITSAMISMAMNLNLETIAEGVETDEQMRFLQDRSCHVMQGFLFSQPVPAKEFPHSAEGVRRLDDS